MLDYKQWLQRAVEFTDNMRRLPGDVKVEIAVAPPLSEAEIAELARTCRLPIPEPLRRFWREASGHCHCTYWWDTPQPFAQQMRVAFGGYWNGPHVLGGPQFESAQNVVEFANEIGPDWASGFQENSPRDARYWGQSLALFPVSNGDFVGLYVRENAENPPVAYLDHDGCGASQIIAPDFDAFLSRWESLAYAWMHLLCRFRNKKTGMIDPAFYANETEALCTMLRGEVRHDLSPSPPTPMTETEWVTSNDPEFMLNWLEKEGRLDERKIRLFGCACCRRVWNQMGSWGHRAVETAERYGDGLVSRAQLDEAGLSLLAGERSSVVHAILQSESQWPLFDTWSPGRPDVQTVAAANAERYAFSRRQGIMHEAAVRASTVRASTGAMGVSWEIIRHLDEPECDTERAAHADLVRHLFGNPFRPPPVRADLPANILPIAERLYAGEPCVSELRQALDQAGQAELAEHFRTPDHPKGCWAIDLILGK